MLPAEYAFELFSLVVRRRKGYITETRRTCCHVKGVGQWTAEKGRRGGDLAKNIPNVGVRNFCSREDDPLGIESAMEEKR